MREKQGTISLQRIKNVHTSEVYKGRENVFVLVMDSNRAYFLQGEDQQDTLSWVEAIVKLKQFYTSLTQSWLFENAIYVDPSDSSFDLGDPVDPAFNVVAEVKTSASQPVNHWSTRQEFHPYPIRTLSAQDNNVPPPLPSKPCPETKPVFHRYSKQITQTQSQLYLMPAPLDNGANAKRKRPMTIQLSNLNDHQDLLKNMESMNSSNLTPKTTTPRLQNTKRNGWIDDEEEDSSTTQNELLVNLNVGGQHFTTYLHTLTKIPDTFFSTTLFSLNAEADGSYFIDRNYRIFEDILDYLRTGDLFIPTDPKELWKLRQEAKYYRLQEILEKCNNVSKS